MARVMAGEDRSEFEPGIGRTTSSSGSTSRPSGSSIYADCAPLALSGGDTPESALLETQQATVFSFADPYTTRRRPRQARRFLTPVAAVGGLAAGLALLVLATRTGFSDWAHTSSAPKANSPWEDSTELFALHGIQRDYLHNKPRGDTRKYMFSELPNGLKVLNIEDEHTLRAAVATAVEAGSFDDPLELPGLAHFCEHMLFLGTKGYPKPSDFDNFVSKHGGYDNAYTASEVTVYYGEVAQAAGFSEMKRLADFFSAPLFHDRYVEKEVHAINSEHLKNIQDPEARILAVMNSLADPDSPVSRFHTGNLETLYKAPMRNGTSPVDALKTYFRTHYCPSRMTVATYSSKPLGQQLQETMDTYGKIDAGDCKGKVETFKKPKPFPPSRMRRWVSILGTESQPSLWVQWQFADLTKEYPGQPFEYIYHVLSYDGVDSFSRVLSDSLGLATSMSVEQDMTSAGTSLYMIIRLTHLGRNSLQLVLELLYAYLSRLVHEGVNLELYKSLALVNRLEWDWSEPEGPAATVEDFAERMTRLPHSHLLSGDSLIWFKKPKLVEHILKKLSPDNMNVALVDDNIDSSAPYEADEAQTLPHWGVNFTVMNLSEAVSLEALERWQGWMTEDNRSLVEDTLADSVEDADIKPVGVIYPKPPKAIGGLPKDITLAHMHVKPVALATSANASTPKSWEVAATLFGPSPQPLDLFGSNATPFAAPPKVWYRSGWITQSPKVTVCVVFRPMRSRHSIEATALENMQLTLYQRLLGEEMVPKMVDLTMAGVSYSINVGYFSGLSLTFTGFGHVLPRLVQTTMDEINRFNSNYNITTKSRYNRVTEEIEKDLTAFNSMPVHYALSDRSMFIMSGMHSRTEMLDALSGDATNLKSVSRSASDLVFSEPLVMTALAMGNFAEETAGSIVKSIADGLQLPTGKSSPKASILHGEVHHVTPVVRLTKPIELRMVNPRPGDPNDVTVVSLINGVETIESQVLLGILGQILHTVTYNELRTNRQLGYVVEAGYGRLSNVDYLSAIVQGTALGADKVEEAIEVVFSKFMVKRLEKLTDEELMSYKDAMTDSLVEPPVQRSSEVGHFWEPVQLGGKCFHRDEAVLRYLNSTLVSRAKLLQVWKDLAMPSYGHRRKITVKYFNKKVPPQPDDMDVKRSMSKEGIPAEDIYRLVSERSVSSVFRKADSAARLKLAEEGGYYPLNIHCHLSQETEHALALEALQKKASAQEALAEPLLAALGKRAVEVVEAMEAEDVVTMLKSYAMLGKKPDSVLLNVLGDRVKDSAKELSPEDLLEVLDAFMQLRSKPQDDVFDAIGESIRKAAPRMDVGNITTVINEYLILEHSLDDGLQVALDRRVHRIAPYLSAAQLNALVLSYIGLWRSRLGLNSDGTQQHHRLSPSAYSALLEDVPGRLALASLCQRASALAPKMSAVEVVAVLQAFKTFWTMAEEAVQRHGSSNDEVKLKEMQRMQSLGQTLLGALGDRLGSVAMELPPADLAMILEAYAAFGQAPPPYTLKVLVQRLQNVVAELSADDVARTFAAYSKLKALSPAESS